MDIVMELGMEWLRAVGQLLLHPFYYVGLLFIVLQYHRQIALERKLFSTKLHSLLSETWRTLLWGWLGGLAASVLMAGIGARMDGDAALLLWVVTLGLILFRFRFLCWAYAVGVLGMLQPLVGAVPALQQPGQVWSGALQALLALDIPALLVLVAVLHLIEALLIHGQGTRLGTPLFLESKRGRIVGAYQLQGFWPLALFLLVPAGGSGGVTLPWAPLLGGEGAQAAYTFLALPAMIGFTDLTYTRLPRDKARISSNLLLLYAGVLLLLALLAAWWSPAVFGASLLCIAMHEAVFLYSRRSEESASPLFVHNGRGLKVLGILPGSAAAELGVQIGESLYKVNGMVVRTRQELHQAMSLNPAFCRMEILNLAGESKFLKRAIFSGEHHMLGIILAPDDEVVHFAVERPLSLWSYLTRRGRSVSRQDSTRSRSM